jgi:hypothetical protein
MPTFIDHHLMANVSPEAAEGIAEKLRAGEPDEFGVRGLNVFLPIRDEDVVKVEAVADSA